MKTYKVYLIWSYKLKVMHFISVGVFSEISRDLSVMGETSGRAKTLSRKCRGLCVKFPGVIDFSHRVAS